MRNMRKNSVRSEDKAKVRDEKTGSVCSSLSALVLNHILVS